MDYQKIYNDLIEKRKLNPYTSGYSETHHILPRSLGGNDEKSNLVILSAKEHYIAHLLLCKIYEYDKSKFYKMIKAFTMMGCISDNQERYFNSNTYKYYREEFSNLMSLSQSGEKNSNYGKSWYHNLELKISKSFYHNEVPDGWIKGRIINFDKYLLPKKKKIRKKSKVVKIKKEVVLSEKSKKFQEKKKLYSEIIDWDFLYEIYRLYGYKIALEIYPLDITRNNLLMQFKKRVKNYNPNFGNNFKTKNNDYKIW